MHLIIREDRYDASTNAFELSLLFDGNTSFRVALPNPGGEKLCLWEWYFEEYTQSKEPDSLSKKRAGEVEQSILEYGKMLFEATLGSRRVFSHFEAGLRRDRLSGLSIEIDGESTAFHAIPWETLFYDGFDRPLVLLNGTRLFRKNYNPVDYEAKVKPLPYLNLLLVTARPREEEDVNYRTIQRPVVEAVRRAGQRARIYILRPGTYQALVKHLEDKGEGFYHIIHFDVHGNVFSYQDLKRERKKHAVQFSAFNFAADNFQVNWGIRNVKPFEGKRAFLYFESEEKGVAIPVEANELAGQLKQHSIPVCILNACQSAKQDYTGNETSIGKVLVESGMELVLAMRYSVLASAATAFMTEFYRQLFKSISVEQAIGFARRELHHNKNRAVGQNSIELEDWLLPVVFVNKGDVGLGLRDFNSQEEKDSYYLEKASRPSYPAGFNARGLDLLKVEKMLSLQHNHLLVKGGVEISNTLFMQYLAAWWEETNFVEHAFFFSFEDRFWSLPELVEAMAERILPKEEVAGFLQQSPVVQQMELSDKLKEKRCAILLDGVEEDMLPLRDFLRGVTESLVVYACAEEVYWVKELASGCVYELKPLSGSYKQQGPDIVPGVGKPGKEAVPEVTGLTGSPSAPTAPKEHSPTNPLSERLSDIRKLLSRNKLEKAFEQLFAIAPGNEELVVLSASYEQAARDNRMGLFSSDDYNARRNRIVYALLGLVKEMEENG